VEQLTDAQRECLRLVGRGFQSKEIARELGISIDGVNKRLAGAMGTLGVSSRFEAARRLADHEAGEGYQPLVGQPVVVAAEPVREDVDVRSETKEANDDEPANGSRVAERQAPYLVHVSPDRRQYLSPLFRQLVATPNRVFLLALVVGVILALLTR